MQVSGVADSLSRRSCVLVDHTWHQAELSVYELLPHEWHIISQSHHVAVMLGFLLCAMGASKGRCCFTSQRVLGSKFV